jgi:hypothetical protein
MIVDLRSSRLTKAHFACSNRIAITPSLRKMLLAASCLQPLAIRLILRSQCARTKLLVGPAMTLHVLNSTSGSLASLVRTEQKGIALMPPLHRAQTDLYTCR